MKMSSINFEYCVCNVDILMELHVTIGYEDLSVCTIDKIVHGENFTDTQCCEDFFIMPGPMTPMLERYIS